jgi:hypothetical protein
LKLEPAIQKALESFEPDHPWTPLLQNIAGAGLKNAGDLSEAREAFIPFSSALVEFVKVARQQNETLASLRIYRCPMAPKPGFWMQRSGPLRNPYFGHEMLDCGTEIAP